jgi:GNAT superfamily N-acetyltransferase
MDIEIKELTPGLAEDYINFFDNTPHNEAGHGDKCYCVTHCDDIVYRNGGTHWYPTAEERRAHALQRVKDGNIQGYLAYCSGEIVGWCNANTKSNCEEILEYWRYGADIPIEESKAGEKVKLIFCFAIAPRMQKMGIAAKMLEYICHKSAEQGFEYVEASTHTELTQDGFRGPLSLYEKCGFSKQAEKNGKVVVRKYLK